MAWVHSHRTQSFIIWHADRQRRQTRHPASHLSSTQCSWCQTWPRFFSRKPWPMGRLLCHRTCTAYPSYPEIMSEISPFGSCIVWVLDVPTCIQRIRSAWKSLVSPITTNSHIATALCMYTHMRLWLGMQLITYKGLVNKVIPPLRQSIPLFTYRNCVMVTWAHGLNS